MLPLYNTDFEVINNNLVRLRTPLVSDSLYHAIAKALSDVYISGFMDDKDVDVFKWIERLSKISLEDISQTLKITIVIVNEDMKQIKRIDNGDKMIVLLELPSHYEVIGIIDNNHIRTVLITDEITL